MGLLEFLLKICLKMFKMKDVKEYSVKWTHWDSNRECLKFDEVGNLQVKLLQIIISHIVSGKCTRSNSH